MTKEQKEAMNTLVTYRSQLSVQAFRTFRGQIKAGDTQGFRKGLEKILRRKADEE